MCDDNCENLKPDRIRCEACRTINLALHNKPHKPDMQVYSKCIPAPGPCVPVQERPLHPTCIKVCTRDEYNLVHGMRKKPPIPKVPIGHGPLVYAVKAGILVGAAYFTYSQGVWGDQKDVTECVRRWQEHVKSFHTRRPPEYDVCGKVIMKETSDSIVAPAYALYKGVVTTCFSGIVKFPLIVKCMYLDYLAAIERKEAAQKKERQIRKSGV